MRIWLALSSFLAGLLLGMFAPSLSACNGCPYEPPAFGTYTILDAPGLPEMVGGTVTVLGGVEGERESGNILVIRYDYQGHATEATYRLPW